MMELAAVNWEDIVLVGTAMGIFGGGRMLLARKTGNSNNGRFSQRRCDDKHEALDKLIDERHRQLSDNVRKIFDRLDTLTEHLIK